MADKSHGSVVPPKGRSNKGVLIVIGVVVALLLAGLAWWMVASQEPEPVSNVPQYSMEQLSAEIDKKLGTRSYQEAIDLIEGQKTINEPETQVLLANVYATQKNYTKALAIYAELDKAGKLNSHSAAAAGSIAEQAKDYKTALHYYQVAVEEIKGEHPANDDEKHMYDAKVEELEKKQ